MGYPTVSRLACVLSLTQPRGDHHALLARARDAALAAIGGGTAWAATVRDLGGEDEDDMFAGRPIGPAVHAVIEVTGERLDDMPSLVKAARAIGEVMAGSVEPKQCDVVIGTAYCALSGASDAALVMTFNRDRRTDEPTFMHWWQNHHSRFNRFSPTGRAASRRMISYQLVSRDDALSAAGAEAAGFVAGYDMYESILVDDPVRYVEDVVASGHGEAALYDEEGFLSHEWRIGTPEDAAQARENGRDLMRIAMLDLIA